jgi:mRNA-degrading endonuclease RelE of RelBE toxin-antitoxin system
VDEQYSARRGEYRVRYVIDDVATTITTMGVDHRRDAYRPH